MANSITPDAIAQLRATPDKSTFVATEDMKCFAKCAIDKSGFLVPGQGIDVERVVGVSVASGKNEAKVRDGIAKCKSLFKGAETCDEAWALYTCINA